MKTYNQKIVSPFQFKNKGFDVSDKNHPVQEEVRKNIGVYNLTAEILEDKESLNLFRHIPGLVAFVCKLKNGPNLIGYGRGTTVLSSMNRYIEKSVRSACNASLIDAVVKSIKMMDVLNLNNGRKGSVSSYSNKYDISDDYQPESITNKQLAYLRELIMTNVDDEQDRERQLSELEFYTKDEASEAIQSFKN